MKFNGNLSSGNGVFPCGQTDIQKLIVGFGNFVNVPKNSGCVLVTEFSFFYFFFYKLDNAEYLFLYRSHFYSTGEEVRNLQWQFKNNKSYLLFNPSKMKRRPLYLKPQSIPRSKTLFILDIKTNQFML
jgi:hypothetical protein